MRDPEILEAIELTAPMRGLPVELVVAIVKVESGGNTFAWNPEPHYRWLWDARKGQPYRVSSDEAYRKSPPRDFRPPRGLASDRDAEWWGQQASWGAMQIMGAVARELGFAGHFPRLCNPHVGVQYGCRHLEALVRRFKRRHGLPGVVAAYNAGSVRRSIGSPKKFVNQAYVDKVAKAGGFG